MRSRTAFFALTLCAGALPGAALAQGAPEDAPNGSLVPNQGHILCTAAINSSGAPATAPTSDTVIQVPNTKRLGPGLYQVAFLPPCGNVQIKNGWFRIVQVDSLSTGAAASRFCTTWDSSLINAVIVKCFSGNNTPANTSFTISVSR
jgi:hypothetical protein